MVEIATEWMLARTPNEIVAVGPESEVVITFEDGVPESLSEGALATELTKLGILVESDGTDAMKDGHSLADAITNGWNDEVEPEVIWTAEEVMVLPAGIDPDHRLAAIETFVAGIQPDGRLKAYARLMHGAGEIHGDCPDATMLTAALGRLESPVEIQVVELRAPHAIWTVAPAVLAELDCSAAHRLGPIVRISPPESLADEGLPDISYTVAETREADLARPSAAVGRRVQGSGDPALGELVARAEGAERLAFQAHPETLSGSGIAAQLDEDSARSAALAELIERDAFMWTWIQQLSRERIEPASAPNDAQRWREVLRAKGWQTHWINLSLESWPVVLCCLVHDELGLQLGAACRADAASALRKATLEALILALRFDPAGHATPAIEDVREPVEHLMLHRDPELARFTSFLYAAADSIDISEIAGAADPLRALNDAGIAVGFERIDSPQSRPFSVVRASSEALLPMTFGYGEEPLGRPLARAERFDASGRAIGSMLGPDPPELPVPHPFA